MDYHDVDDDAVVDSSGLRHEFECPECSANNPHPEGFTEGSELMCFCCGVQLLAKKVGGRIKLVAG